MSASDPRPVAVVTGATRGIGRACAADLARDHDVVALGRDPQLLAELAALPTVAPTLVHGDLMGHNMLWNGTELTGVIDWDHACLYDPAHDAASLGLWYGWDALRGAVSEGVYERARLHARTFPLQAVAYALHHDLDTAQVNQAVARADDWIEANLRVPSA